MQGQRLTFHWETQILGDPRYIPHTSEGLETEKEKVRKSEGCVLAYDVGSKDSFDYIKWLYKECYLEQRDFPSRFSLPRPFWVIANKINRDRDIWEVSLSEGEAFAGEIGAPFFPMSTWTREGVGGVQEQIASRILAIRDGTLPIVSETTNVMPAEENFSSQEPTSAEFVKGWMRRLKKKVVSRVKPRSGSR